jgi:hypothetical protein
MAQFGATWKITEQSSKPVHHEGMLRRWVCYCNDLRGCRSASLKMKCTTIFVMLWVIWKYVYISNGKGQTAVYTERYRVTSQQITMCHVSVPSPNTCEEDFLLPEGAEGLRHINGELHCPQLFVLCSVPFFLPRTQKYSTEINKKVTVESSLWSQERVNDSLLSGCTRNFIVGKACKAWYPATRNI